LILDYLLMAAAHPTDTTTVDSRTALGAFFRVTDAWGLSTDQQIVLLGAPARSTFFKWKKEGGLLPNDTIERISHLLNIYKCLEILLPEPSAADGWIKRPNRYWEGQSALEKMLRGRMADIIDVRRYLDASRGG
jgi:hypothetical protein